MASLCKSVESSSKSLLNSSKRTGIVRTGRKTAKNGYESSEYLDRFSWNNELQTLWASSGRGKVEEFEYVTNGLTVKVKGSFYTPEDLKDNRSWICKNCVCHEECLGYYYERIGMDFDQSLSIPNLDLKSLRRVCRCSTCKHSLNLDLLK